VLVQRYRKKWILELLVELKNRLLPVKMHNLNPFLVGDVEQVVQAVNMVFVVVRQENVKLGRADLVSHPKKPRAGVKHNTKFRQHNARGLSRLIGMVPGSAQKYHSHIPSYCNTSKNSTFTITESRHRQVLLHHYRALSIGRASVPIGAHRTKPADGRW